MVNNHACHFKQNFDISLLAFAKRCTEKLEHLGDEAAKAQEHDDAIAWYSAALSLNFPAPHLFIKRSKVYVARRLWDDALNDVNRVRAFLPA